MNKVIPNAIPDFDMAGALKQPPIVCKGIRMERDLSLPPFTLQKGGLLRITLDQQIGSPLQRRLVGFLTGNVRHPSIQIDGCKPQYSSEIGRASGIAFGFLCRSADWVIRRYLHLEAALREDVFRRYQIDSSSQWSALRFTERIVIALGAVSLVTDKIIFDTSGLDPTGEETLLSQIEGKRREGVSFVQLTYVWPQSQVSGPAEVRITGTGGTKESYGAGFPQSS